MQYLKLGLDDLKCYSLREIVNDLTAKTFVADCTAVNKYTLMFLLRFS